MHKFFKKGYRGYDELTLIEKYDFHGEVRFKVIVNSEERVARRYIGEPHCIILECYVDSVFGYQRTGFMASASKEPEKYLRDFFMDRPEVGHEYECTGYPLGNKCKVTQIIDGGFVELKFGDAIAMFHIDNLKSFYRI